MGSWWPLEEMIPTLTTVKIVESPSIPGKIMLKILIIKHTVSTNPWNISSS